jgi:hypothetical protein
MRDKAEEEKVLTGQKKKRFAKSAAHKKAEKARAEAGQAAIDAAAAAATA